MNESPVVGGGLAVASLRRLAVAGIGRVILAGLVLALTAAVVTMSGGAGLGGRLGSLFGLHTRQGGKPATAIQVAAPAPVLHSNVVARVTPRRHAGSAPRVRLRSRRPAATGPRRTQVPSPPPTSPPVQAAPAPPPVQAPKPAPAPGGNVERATQQVHDVVAPAAPPVAPVLDQTVTTVRQACGLIGGCP